MSSFHSVRVVALAIVALTACADSVAEGDGLRGDVRVDGSSTVYPIQAGAAETFAAAYPKVRVTVGVSGTRGGLRRLCTGEIDLAGASRRMSAEERAACSARGIEPLELPIARGGVTVVAPAAWGLECLTLDELRRLWRDGSAIRRWSELRPDLPDEPVSLFGAGASSGTFDIFTEAVLGTPRQSRPDYQASEDDNVIVAGVAGARYALGFVGYGYYATSGADLRAIAVDAGNGCVEPGPVTIAEGRYRPLGRTLYLYVDPAALDRPAVSEFVRYFLLDAERLVGASGLQPLTTRRYLEVASDFDILADR